MQDEDEAGCEGENLLVFTLKSTRTAARRYSSISLFFQPYQEIDFEHAELDAAKAPPQCLGVLEPRS
jgi:hypothetical protein